MEWLEVGGVVGSGRSGWKWEERLEVGEVLKS